MTTNQPKNKPVFFLFLLFAAAFFFSQLGYTINNRWIKWVTAPFDKLLPDKMSFFAPVRPHNYRIEVFFYDVKDSLIGKEELIQPVVDNFMQAPFQGSTYFPFEFLLNASYRLHALDYWEETNPHDSALVERTRNPIVQSLFDYIRLTHKEKPGIATIQYETFVTYVDDPGREIIYTSGRSAYGK